jgi:peptidoglycan/xylan/chitin deacetylase (PgdA/CDA1 family)
LHQPLPPARFLLWTTSVTGFACVGGVLAGHAPPLVVTAGLFGVHALVATLGVLLPGLSVFGDVLGRGPRARPEIALTFDDGPHPETTRSVLAVLAAARVRATFFVLGDKVRKHADVVREVVAAGHAVGLHGYTHDPFYSLRSAARIQADIEAARAAVEAACGVRAVLFRPPVGFVSHTVALAADRAGVTLVGFSARTRDGLARTDSTAVLARATAALENGAILVLHDAAERDDRVPASLAVLGELCAEVARRGFVPVTLDELRRER